MSRVHRRSHGPRTYWLYLSRPVPLSDPSAGPSTHFTFSKSVVGPFSPTFVLHAISC